MSGTPEPSPQSQPPSESQPPPELQSPSELQPPPELQPPSELQPPGQTQLPPKKPDGPPKRSADDALPPVAAPDASFLLQLFLIPLIIVTIIVMVWLLFSWLAHMGGDPRDLVRDLRVINEASWQKANTLADMLRNHEYDYLKDDEELAGELADVLLLDLKAGGSDEKRIRMRIFLCRALGEFRVDTGLPALLIAAKPSDQPADMDVRYAALEALAVLTFNVGPEKLAVEPGLLATLETASSERSDDPDQEKRLAGLRSTAAFTLGVLGGERALTRLNQMLSDPHPNARFNAANGLARHGDPRAVPVLLEMLDPENSAVVKGEMSDSERLRKRMLVLMNGLRAARQLVEKGPVEKGPNADLETLRGAIQRLRTSDLPNAVRLEASECLLAFPGS